MTPPKGALPCGSVTVKALLSPCPLRGGVLGWPGPAPQWLGPPAGGAGGGAAVSGQFRAGGCRADGPRGPTTSTLDGEESLLRSHSQSCFLGHESSGWAPGFAWSSWEYRVGFETLVAFPAPPWWSFLSPCRSPGWTPSSWRGGPCG